MYSLPILYVYFFTYTNIYNYVYIPLESHFGVEGIFAFATVLQLRDQVSHVGQCREQQRAKIVCSMKRWIKNGLATASDLQSLLSQAEFNHIDDHVKGAWEELLLEVRKPDDEESMESTRKEG